MRAVLFRGKRHDGIWMYGDLLHSCCNTYTIIQPEMIQRHIVLEETVGQFTGLYDKDGKRIYEGDILCIKDGGALLTVEFRHGAFGYEYCGEFHSWAGNHNFTFNPFDTDVDFAIIGNIHDNPELLTNK